VSFPKFGKEESSEVNHNQRLQEQKGPREHFLRLRGGASSQECQGEKRKAPHSSPSSPSKTRILQLETTVGVEGIFMSEHLHPVGSLDKDQRFFKNRTKNIHGRPASETVEEIFSFVASPKMSRATETSTLEFDWLRSLRLSCLKGWRWITPSPNASLILSTLQIHGIPRVIPRLAYYSREEDVPLNREYAGRSFRLVSNALPYLPQFNAKVSMAISFPYSQPSASQFAKIWRIERRAPFCGRYGTVVCGLSCDLGKPIKREGTVRTYAWTKKSETRPFQISQVSKSSMSLIV